MQIESGRPPYVRFELRAVIDHQASEKAGHIVYRNVDYALVTPAGSKDEHEKIAGEWIPQLKRQAMNNAYPSEWANRFSMAYEEWKKGNEIPENGLSVTHWPVATPAEAKQCLAANIRTVEDLAELPESGLQMLGMGGRVLRDKARAWLQSANDHGKLAQRIGVLEQANRDKDQIIEDQSAKIRELEDALPKRGRPRKEVA